VIAAVQAQLEAFTHTCFGVMPYEPYIKLAERMNEIAPMRGPNKTIFLTTGAEAIENAVKIARCATGRSAIISFSAGFHGRTMMALALTGKVNPYKAGFGPFPADTFHVPFPDAYRGGSSAESLRAIEALFKASVEPSRVAAIVIEPVQGEGGFNVAPFEFLRELRALCDRHGIVFIADEIQTGFGRTGRMFAVEHAGVEPDLITIAKSLGGGFPLSGVVGKASIMDAVAPGGLGGTFAGSPVSCAAALAVLDIFRDEDVLARAEKQGAMVRARLDAMRETFDCVGDVRGLGAMLAIELVKDRATREAAPDLAKQLALRAAERGLIILTCGIYGNVVRILVPLIAPLEFVDEGLSLLEQALGDVAK
ncbi:MAG TPA: 4-aminobutyrate--2-oxoglutarate transaminase, partial [Candidatus Acidoferrales bacterium]|nr:4-aminobutyrate--2-oxoglutarate transaminase [Candidatus Acidoferrales bacterium]